MGTAPANVSARKNGANKRMSALNNATSLVVAKGGDALDEVKVLEIAQRYLDFLGKAD